MRGYSQLCWNWAHTRTKKNSDQGGSWTRDLWIWPRLLHWLSHQARTGAGPGYLTSIFTRTNSARPKPSLDNCCLFVVVLFINPMDRVFLCPCIVVTNLYWMWLHWLIQLKLREWKQLLSVICLKYTPSTPLLPKEFSLPTVVHSFPTVKWRVGNHGR